MLINLCRVIGRRRIVRCAITYGQLGTPTRSAKAMTTRVNSFQEHLGAQTYSSNRPHQPLFKPLHQTRPSSALRTLWQTTVDSVVWLSSILREISANVVHSFQSIEKLLVNAFQKTFKESSPRCRLSFAL